MCMSSKAPPAAAPAAPPPAPPPVLEQDAPATIKKTDDKLSKKRKGTKKYRTDAVAINGAAPTSGLSIPK